MWKIAAISWAVTAVSVAGGVGWGIFQNARHAAEIAELSQRAHRFEQEAASWKSAAESSTEVINQLENEISNQGKALDQLAEREREARIESERMTEIFRSHNLGELLNAKPGMIIPRINKATEELWAKFD